MGEQMDEREARATVVPAFVDGHEWSACFGLSWADLLLYDQAGPNRIIRPGGQYVRKVAGTMGVAAARSEIAAHFLANTDADYLFMVDTDMGFAPDTVDCLVATSVAHNAGVVGALCFAQKLDPDLVQGQLHSARFRIIPTLYRWAEIAETGERGFRHIDRYQRDAYQTVGATGAACMLVSRAALEAAGPDPFAPLTADAGGNGTSRIFSEDLSFCVRVAAAGIEIGVDTSIKTTHHKGGFYLDETTYAMQQEILIQAKGHAIVRQTEAWMRAGAPRGADGRPLQPNALGLYVPNGASA